MFSSLARSASLARRSIAPAAYFGAGVACHWAWGREETVPQLLACGTAASWAAFAAGARHLRQALPEEGAWARERLAQVESAELRVLTKVLVATCAEKGLDSAWLRRIALRRICEVAEEDPRSLAVVGLVPPPADESTSSSSSSEGAPGPAVATAPAGNGPVGNGLVELAELIDDAAIALDTASVSSTAVGERAEVLPCLTAALQVLCGDDHRSSAKELGAEGSLCVAHSATLAATWLAEERRRVAVAEALAPPLSASDEGASPASAADLARSLPLEEEAETMERLSSVWQALTEPRFAAFLRSSPRSAEARERRYQLEQNFKGLAETREPPPSEAALPAQEFLPASLRKQMAAAIKCGRISRATASHKESKGLFAGVGKMFEVAAWLAIIGAAVVAVSQDGFKIFQFHAVPEQWRPMLQNLILEPAVKIEELLAKYDPHHQEGGPQEDSIMLGPWGAQSNYLAAAPATRVQGVNLEG